MELSLIKIWFGKMLEALKLGTARTVPDSVDHPEDRRRESFAVVSGSLRIRGWILFPVVVPSRQYPVVVICHGIPGSGAPRPADDPGYESLAQTFCSLGVASVVFNFRGCGNSEGDFDMAGWPKDLDAVLDKVSNTPYLDPSRVIVIGFSGGGAAAIQVAAENPAVFALAAVSSPAHFEIFKKEPEEVVEDFRKRGIIRDPNFPPDLDRWIDGFREIEPRRWIPHFKGKHLLIVHGDADELIPVEHARELFEHAPGGVGELAIIPGGEHRLRLDPRCIEILKSWICKVLGWK
jgi:uncharacterized protein